MYLHIKGWHSYSIFIGGGGARGDAIDVSAIQAVVNKSHYSINMLLGEFKNITQYTIKNKHTINNHKFK